LTVIGAHCQDAKDEEVAAKAKSLGVNYTIVKRALFTKGASDIKIPHCFLFDHTGKCLYSGSPDNADKQLRSAVGAALVEGLEPQSKSVTGLATALKSGQPPPAILQRAVPLLKAKDPALAEEAKLLMDKICFVGRAQFDEADGMKETDPFAAYTALERLPAQYKGTPLGADATKLLTDLKKDKTVQAELKARPALTAIKTIDETLSKAAKTAKVDVSDVKFQRTNSATLAKLRTGILNMKKTHPDTKSTEQAVAIAEKYGLMLP
jgi:hypothetical protein